MERPITSKGAYNLNFIDFENEWENIAESSYNWRSDDNDQDCPITGMDITTFNEIMAQEDHQQQQEEEENNECQMQGLSQQQMAQLKTMKMGKSSKECSICVTSFEKGDIILRLPQCKHIFHRECVNQWLTQNTTCPNCRIDLNNFFKS